jgi:hypothetical protein
VPKRAEAQISPCEAEAFFRIKLSRRGWRVALHRGLALNGEKMLTTGKLRDARTAYKEASGLPRLGSPAMPGRDFRLRRMAGLLGTSFDIRRHAQEFQQVLLLPRREQDKPAQHRNLPRVFH